MIEVASGEYDPDMTKLAKAATRKYEKTALLKMKDLTISKNDGELLINK